MPVSIPDQMIHHGIRGAVRHTANGIKTVQMSTTANHDHRAGAILGLLAQKIGKFGNIAAKHDHGITILVRIKNGTVIPGTGENYTGKEIFCISETANMVQKVEMFRRIVSGNDYGKDFGEAFF